MKWLRILKTGARVSFLLGRLIDIATKQIGKELCVLGRTIQQVQCLVWSIFTYGTGKGVQCELRWLQKAGSYFGPKSLLCAALRPYSPISLREGVLPIHFVVTSATAPERRSRFGLEVIFCIIVLRAQDHEYIS